MTLALELAGAFLAGAISSLLAGGIAAKWYMRRKFGGMLDLITAKK